MKSLFISTYDIKGGAARASYRLFGALRASEIDVSMFVLSKSSDDPAVFAPRARLALPMHFAASHLEALPLRGYPPRPVMWSLNWVPYPVGSYLSKVEPDIFHVHWIGEGFFPIRVLGSLRRPIVWTLHDEWAYTGGCHYSYDCSRFRERCGACPQLQSDELDDLSRRVWTRKARVWEDLDITLVAPSRWIAERAQSSALFKNNRVEIIPNGIDTGVYKPIDKAFARHVLNLPQDKKLVLFGALSSTSDRRKGYDLLRPAIARLAESEWADSAEVMMFGSSQITADRSAFPLKMHILGVLQDDIALTMAYAAADVFVAPSLQDNLPNTVMEALACGTPCIAFEIGGMPDLIAHQIDGYLVEPYNLEQLADALKWILEDEPRLIELSIQARNRAVERFDQAQIAARYAALYRDVLDRARRNPV